MKTISFSIWDFFHNDTRIRGLQGKEEGISLTSDYHLHPLYRHLDISLVITPEAHLYIYVAAGFEPETLGFRAQVTNH